MSSKYTTLAALYVAITRLLDGEDVTISDVSTATLDQLLTVAQQRIYRDVRSRWNEKSFSGVVVASNLAPLPDDYEAPAIVHFGRQALIPVSEHVIRDFWAATGAAGNGTDLYFSAAGNALTFYPAESDGAAVQGRYYARLPFLTDANMASNLLYQNADDLFIYGCLVESAIFFGESPNMQAWEAKYESILDRLNVGSHRTAYAAGRMQQRGVGICGRGRRGYR